MEDLQMLINEWEREATTLMTKIQNNPALGNYQFINGSVQRLRLCIAEVDLLLHQQQPNSEPQPQLQQADVMRRFSDEVKNGRGVKESVYAQALGFNEPYYAQSAMHNYRHLIHFGNVVAAIDWLRSQGWDLVKMA